MVPTSASRPRRARRVRRSVAETARPAPRRSLRLLFWLALPVVLIAAAPTVVAMTPLRNVLLNYLIRDLDATLTAESAGLGWFSDTQFNDLTLLDRDGAVVLTAARLTSTATVTDVVVLSSGLGHVTVDEARVEVAVTADGSNLETLLAPWLENDDSDGGMSGITLELHDAVVAVRDESTGHAATLEAPALKIVLPSAVDAPIEAAGAFVVTTSEASGRGELELSLPQTNSIAGSCRFTFDGIPLAAVDVLQRRLGSDALIEGRAAAYVTYRWQGPLSKPDDARLEGQLTVDDFVLTGPWLERDRLELARVELPCYATLADGVLDVEQLAFSCDLGTARYAGRANVEAGIVDALTNQTYELSAQADLAGLAEQLGGLVQVREGTQITSGMVEVALRSDAKEHGSQWQGIIDVTAIEANDRGRPLRWNRPFAAEFSGRYDDGQPIIDVLRANASFMELKSAGTAEHLSVNARVDLDQLRNELSRFLEIEPTSLGGHGTFAATWNQTDDSRFQVSANTDLVNVNLPSWTKETWREERLVAQLELEATRSGATIERIERAAVKLASTRDQLQGQLAGPVDLRADAPNWPVQVAMEGDLAAWLPRLRAFVGPLDEWQLQGNGRLNAAVVASADEFVVQSLEAQVVDLAIRNASMNVIEPGASLRLAGRWRTEPSEFELTESQFSSPTLEIDATPLRGRLEDGGAAVSEAIVTYRADVARLQQWFAKTDEPSTTKYEGMLVGQASLAPRGTVRTASWQATIEPLVVRGADTEHWQEPKVTLAGHADYDVEADVLDVSQIELKSATLGVTAHGAVSHLSSSRELALDGVMKYDMQRLAGWLRDAGGIPIELQGRDSSPFSVRGALGAANVTAPETASVWYETLDVSASTGWDVAALYGFRFGPGRLAGTMSNSRIDVDPLHVSVNGGQMHLTPHVSLAPGGEFVTLAPGPLLEKVRVTPQMCDQALAYIAPALAGATDVQGDFSLALADCRIPLADPKQGTVTGQLTVHSIDVSAGPLVRELALVLGRAPSVQLKRSSVVDFQWVEGRVYHRNLELVFPDVTVRTHGSVGFDRTLALVAEMPVPPKWIGTNSLGRSLEGKTLRLPINGTLDHPQLDKAVLEQATGQLMRETTGDLLRGELMRGLNKLLPPPSNP